MRAMQTLIGRHARDARLSLVATPLVSAATLGVIHAWFPGPSAVSQAAAIAVAVLAVLWTLYFSADAFASDSTSGRLATQALLPVSSLVLWCSRATFVALAVSMQLAWTVACGYALQLACGDADSLAHFESALGPLCGWLPMLPLLGAAAMLGSLVVESALAAMIVALLSLGGLALAATPAVRALALVGIEVVPSVTRAAVLASALAACLLAIGALAFIRAARRLGSRAVRVAHVAWPLAAVATIAGLATAAEVRRRMGVELENPLLRYCGATASDDGRLLALEVQHDLVGNDDPPPLVWLLDVDRGERELLARPGHLVRDRYAHSSLEWSRVRPLRVLDLGPLSYGSSGERIDVALAGSRWKTTSRPTDLAREDSWSATRIVPAWAEIETSKAVDGARTTTVRWSERGLVARFVGSYEDTAPGGAVLPTPRPGMVLARRGGRIVMYDMECDGERVVLENDASTWMSPSPDGSAVLVHTSDGTRLLETASGEVLHERWSRNEWSVHWVDSSNGARVLELIPAGVRDPATVIVDLDRATSFQIERDLSQPLLHRLGSRGYAFVRRDGDLVWVDLDGRIVRVLVDR